MTDLEEAAAKLMCESDSDSDLDEQFSKMAINKSHATPTNSAIPTDLLIAAEAARMTESDLDSDDFSSSEESDSDEESEDSTEDSTEDSSEESSEESE